MLMIQNVIFHHRCLVGHLVQVHTLLQWCALYEMLILGMVDFLAKVHCVALKRKNNVATACN